MTDLESFVRELNTVWREGRHDELSRFFADGVVLLPPSGAAPIVGVDAMVESYRAFATGVTVHAFEVVGVEVHEFGSTAVCHLRFRCDYEIDARRFDERGIEVYVVDRTGVSPKIVWRTQIPLR